MALPRHVTATSEAALRPSASRPRRGWLGEQRVDDEAGGLGTRADGALLPTGAGWLRRMLQSHGAPRIDTIRGLQRTHGNLATTRLLAQAVGPGGAVQRYEETRAGAYKDLAANRPAQNQQGGGPTFSAQELTVDPNRQIVAPLQNPDLKVADTGDMAIASAPQPKEFYADDTVVAQSNQKLEGVRSALRLVAAAPNLTVPVPNQEGQTKQLKRVQPTMSGPQGLAALSDKCNEIAAAVMGKSNVTLESGEALFAGTDGQSPQAQAISYRGGSHSLPGADLAKAGPTHVAEFIKDSAGAATDPTRLTTRLGQQSSAPAEDTALHYGRMYPQDRAARGRELGVNEAALPEVGEAFAAFSVGQGNAEPSLDYTREGWTDRLLLGNYQKWLAAKQAIGMMSAAQAEEALKAYAATFHHYVDEPWSWHFAGVVARSGDDAVTLENYNRAPELKKAFLAVYEAAETNHQQRLERHKRGLGHQGKALEQIVEDDPSFPAYAVKELNKELLQAAQGAILQEPDPSSLWYFQMYGSKPGQTFHEAMGKTGDFTNPLTLRVRDQLTPQFVKQHKDELDTKAAELRTRHTGQDQTALLDAQLPGILDPAKGALDRATTKSEATAIAKQAAARLHQLDGELAKQPVLT